MSDDYLWDRSGKDEEVERLEALLGPMALKSGPPRLPTERRWSVVLAQAATIAAVVLAVVFGAVRREEYEVARERRLVDLGVGTVELEPNSRWKVVARQSDLVKLRLQEGTLHASIGAHVKPGLFQVETPATTCVDLGCRYTLTVDASGRSRVSVQTGRVAFVDRGREVYVPSGASCAASRDRGADVPVFDDAPEALRNAVRAIDRSIASRLAVLAACVRTEDALTAWHVMMDGAGEAGYDAMVRLIGAPDGVTREATLAKEPRSIDAWKQRMGWW